MIGSNLVKRLVNMGHDVCVVDNLWRGKKEYLLDDRGKAVIDFHKNFHEIDLSVVDATDPLLEGVGYVYHLADVVAGIKYVFNNQGSLFRQNVLINSNVVSAARNVRLKGFIYVGTACSFPKHMQTGVDAPPLKEEDQYPAAPESAYGWSKLMGEYESLLMEQETGVPVSIPVLHNVYGAPCDYEDGRGQVIPSLIRKAIRYPDEPFIVWGSGSQGRAFIHVDDVVDGLVAAMEKGLGQGIIQLGPDVCTSIREIAETVVEISGKDILIEYDTTKPEGDRGRCADYSKAKRVLGWEPKVKLQDGMANLYQWIEREIRKGSL
jgi:Nucleoside-diphosphate-sugar epimerases